MSRIRRIYGSDPQLTRRTRSASLVRKLRDEYLDYKVVTNDKKKNKKKP